MMYIPLMCQPIEAETPEDAARLFSEMVIKQVLDGTLKISVVPSGDLAVQSYPAVIDIKLNYSEADKCFYALKK